MSGAVARPISRGDAAAEALVVDEVGHRGMLAADDAVRIAPELQHANVHRHGVEVEHAADERLTRAENQLDRLERLHAAYQPGENSEHAGLGTTRGGSRRWRLGEEAAVAGALERIEDA